MQVGPLAYHEILPVQNEQLLELVQVVKYTCIWNQALAYANIAQMANSMSTLQMSAETAFSSEMDTVDIRVHDLNARLVNSWILTQCFEFQAEMQVKLSWQIRLYSTLMPSEGQLDST